MSTVPATPRADPLFVARCIWAALLTCVGLYYAILLAVLKTEAETGNGELAALLCSVLIPLATFLMFVVVCVYHRFLSAEVPAGGSERTLVLYILCWALSEAIAASGFVLGLVGRELETSALFYLWSVCLLGALRPRRGRFALAPAL